MLTDCTGCIVLAAGAEKTVASPGAGYLDEVAYKPILGWVTDAVRASGIGDICIVAQDDAIKKAAGSRVIEFQRERLGTGHALLCARDFLDRGEDTLVLCGDAPFIGADTLLRALSVHRQGGHTATLLLAGALGGETPVTGAALPDALRGEGAVGGWFQTAALLAAFDDLEQAFAGRTLDFSVLAAWMAEHRPPAAGIYSADPETGLRLTGVRSLLELNGAAIRKILEKHLDNGVRFISRDGIVIGPDVEIAPGAQILPGTILCGRTKIGAGCVIGPNSLLKNTEVGARTVINASQTTDCVIGEDATVGPFSHFRPDTRVGDRVKVGDFVEIKNSSVGDGTSVAHLTYIGDADVGRGCNFGCGVVFVNYDGESKNRTVVKDYAFIGCNTNLVAPVTVGEGAYTAANTTVTKDVPDGALAIGRSEQVNKEGWAARKLEKYIRKKQ